MSPCGSAVVHGTREVGCNNRLPVPVAQFDEGRAYVDAGIVDEDIQLAQRVQGMVDRVFNLLELARIRLQCQDPSSRLFADISSD